MTMARDREEVLMNRSKSIVILSLVAGIAGVGWGYAQQLGAGPTLAFQDYFEIQQLYARYALYLDTGNADGFVSLWTTDGEFVAGRPAGQADAVRTPNTGEGLRRQGSSGGYRHFNSNLIITPTAEGADGMVYLIRFNLRKDTNPYEIDQTSIYQDKLVKTPQGWRFKRRVSWRDDDDLSPFRSPAQAPSTPR
jgi:hypothetical protein